MPSTILLRTIGGIPDKKIVLTNSRIARAFSLTWNQIRIGMRCSITIGNAVNVQATPQWFFGLSSGTSSVFGDATATHAVGALLGWTPTTQGWTYQAGQYYGLGQCWPVKKIGTIITQGNSYFTSSCYPTQPASAAGGQRCCFFVDITKGSPNYSFSFLYPSAASAFDTSAALFLEQMELAVPTMANHSYAGVNTVPVDEATNGTLNAVNISWNRSTPQIEISDIAIARLA